MDCLRITNIHSEVHYMFTTIHCQHFYNYIYTLTNIGFNNSLFATILGIVKYLQSMYPVDIVYVRGYMRKAFYLIYYYFSIILFILIAS